jgi:predicted nucleotidyltransferase component of viral defense system
MGSTSVVGVDYSLNEPLGKIETLELGDGNMVAVYDIAELTAEKFRALLQQEKRGRVRRQDIYDLKFLLDTHPGIHEPTLKGKVLNRLLEKSKARELSITKESMGNPVIRQKSKEEYPQLKVEIKGELPPFDQTYDAVELYYRSLPWRQN